jgi:hypothetical protein
MALVLKDRVKESSIVTGTGAAVLLGSSAGFDSFAVIGDGNTTYYAIVSQLADEWEVGIGVYTSVSTSLSRGSVLASSNDGSLVDFTTGVKDVFVTYPASRAVIASDNPGSVGEVLTSKGPDSAPTWELPTGLTLTNSTVPPTSPRAGDEWVDSNSGVKYTYFDDGTSSQWVELETALNIAVVDGVNYTQSSPSETWTIAHNLGIRPSVAVFTTGGLEMMGTVQHLSSDVLQVSFSQPVAGTARLT